MKNTRKSALSVTAEGLLHVDTKPDPNKEQSEVDRELLIRQAIQRGHTDLGWLKSYHTFSFGGYYDQRHMGFRSLRVINDDRIAARKGFPTHPHHDMEIISYVLEGALQHKDSTGKGAIITPDDVQMMSAGRGITHSEYNPSGSEGNHFLQIWIDPAIRGSLPRYSEAKVTSDQKKNRWKKLAGPAGSGAPVEVRQDATIFATKLDSNQELEFTVERNRHAWMQVARGSLTVNGTTLKAGDAIATSFAANLHVQSNEPTDALLFELG